ncbi:MAG: thiamine phosphate synthase [Pseudomonadota bacterium]
MSDPEQPQIYLVTPPAFELETFLPRLSAVLDATDIACVRLALVEEDEAALSRAADALREVAHARDVPLVITRHVGLVERLGLDGVHLTDGARSVRKTRAALGADAIVGAYCEASRHDGMTAGETGADYIAFGPVGDSGLGDGDRVERDLFAWWSQMIELPVVAEGALTVEMIESLAPVTDFFAIGAEIWREDDAVATLSRLTAPLG